MKMKTLHLSIIAILLMVLLFPFNTIHAQILSSGRPNIDFSTPKIDFVDGEIIPISGHAKQNSIVYIFLLDSYGNIENSTQVTSDDAGSFSATLSIPLHVIGGGWYLFAQSAQGSRMSEIMVNTHGVSTMTLSISSLPPLKQFKLGISVIDVKCKQGFQLITKNEDGEPACVTPESASKLVDRGWAGNVSMLSGQLPLIPDNAQNYTSLGNHTLPVSFEPCQDPYPQKYQGIPTLYMPLNSTGEICVRYHNLNDFPVRIGEIEISEANNLTQDAKDVSTWNDSGNNTISAGNSTIVYWAKTGNHKGLYGLTIFCVPMPFAVGYDNSTLGKSNFPWLGQNTWFCPAELYDFHIDSTTGFKVGYVAEK